MIDYNQYQKKENDHIAVKAGEVPPDIAAMIKKVATLATQIRSEQSRIESMAEECGAQKTIMFGEIKRRYPQLDADDNILSFNFDECRSPIICVRKREENTIHELFRRLTGQG